jgi:hypothetical protein
MGKYQKLLALIFSVLLLSCSQINKVKIYPTLKKETYAVIPFENYTITPLAGYRVASILEGVMRAHGYKVLKRVWNYSDQEPSQKEFKIWWQKAVKEGAKIVVYGTVNEFRYKTGIDGEPAVSVTLYFYDTKEKKIIWSATLSKSGLSFQSLGTVCQELFNEALK